VVVPVYRGAETIRELVAGLKPVLAREFEAFEILLVDDGSPDASWDVIAALAAEEPLVRGLRLMRNYGQHNALLCGIRAARHDLIVTMDDDLQHPPEEIPKLLAALRGGYDVVYGTPERARHGLLRNLASAATKMVLKNAMGAQTARRVSAFRAFDTRLREAFAEYGSPLVSIDVLLTWGTTRFTHVLVRHEPRRAGKTNYTVRKLLVHALNMVTGFSVAPLRLASFLGFAFTLFGMGVLAYVLIRYLTFGSAVPGFAFLASVIAVFSGAQLFALGVLGEYLGRVHARTLDRPVYTVREKTGC
jgi:undecaprenyl-phosphate 4-deoxy-4-formamido-L-arabinose transferase